MGRRQILRITAALGASLVAADLAGSLFLIRDGLFLPRRNQAGDLEGRPLPPFGAITYPAQLETLDSMDQQPKGIGVFDPELGWTWRPSTATEDGRFHVDALGARGPREYERSPPAGKRRLIFFGDSFTFCDEIPDQATFQWILEDLDPRFEALNFGVSGYGTDQALLRFRRIGPELGAEVACMGILLENIGRNVNRYRPLWNTRTGFCVTKPRFVLDERGALVLVPQPFATRQELRSAILDRTVMERIREHEYWLERPAVPTGRLSSLMRIAAGYLAYRERSPERLWRDPDGEPFRVTLAVLEAFHREALAAGARLAPILIFPSKEDLRSHALPGKPYWTALLEELDRRRIPYLDLIPPLVKRARELGEDPPAASLYWGGHLSRTGNAIVARELLRWLAERLE